MVRPDSDGGEDEDDVHHHHNSEYLWFATALRNQRTKPHNNHNNHAKPPLRLLVIGDSLAVGVGTSQSSTPVLPEVIAQALSKATGGRAVYWDCVGVPGQSASEIVEDIHHLHLLPPTAAMFRRLAEWQAGQRLRAQDRIETAKRRTQEWLEHRRVPEETETPTKQNRVVQWWKRTTEQLRRDLDGLRNVIQDVESAEKRSSEEIEVAVKRQLMARRNTLDPERVRKYDIAVVLTGLNDVKHSYLPFMRQRSKEKTNSGEKEDKGIKVELVRILDALKDKMGQIMPVKEEQQTTAVQDVRLDDQHSSHVGSCHTENGPLVVFPGLPYEATVLGRYPPLSWFIARLLDMVDRNKQIIAELYPNLVIYVAPPDFGDMSDAEAKRGAQWEDFNVLLNLTDIAHDVKVQVERLMKQHYESWVQDAEEEDNEYLYELDAFGVSMVEPTKKRPGANMVAADGIHPSDIGYDMWGRHIAGAITKAWERRGERSSRSTSNAVE